MQINLSISFLYLQIVGIGEVCLGIQHNGIAFEQGQIAAGNEHFFVASNKNNDRMTGNIELADLTVCPWISLL